MQSARRKTRLLVAALAIACSTAHGVGADGGSRAKNGGFEDGQAEWTAAADGCAVDTTVARSGRQSLRCDKDATKRWTGVTQHLTINQTKAKPIIVGAWSKAKDVTGPKDGHYAIHCDCKFVEETRPGRVDFWVIKGFNVEIGRAHV